MRQFLYLVATEKMKPTWEDMEMYKKIVILYMYLLVGLLFGNWLYDLWLKRKKKSAVK